MIEQPSRMRAVQREQLQQQRNARRAPAPADVPAPRRTLRDRVAAGAAAVGPIVGVALLAGLAALAGQALR